MFETEVADLLKLNKQVSKRLNDPDLGLDYTYAVINCGQAAALIKGAAIMSRVDQLIHRRLSEKATFGGESLWPSANVIDFLVYGTPFE